MAERPGLANLQPRQGLPAQSASVFSTLSELAGKLGREVSKELDASAQKFATEKGQQAFLDGTFRERSGTGIFSKAYNASGIAANAAAAESHMNARLTELAAEHALNPDEFKKAAAKARTDVAATMHPTVRNTGLAQYDNSVLSVFSQLQEKRIGRDRQAQKDNLLHVVNQLRERTYRDVSQGDLSQVDERTAQFEEWMEAAAPMGVSEGEVQQFRHEWTRGMKIAAVKGEVDRQILKGNGFASVMELLAKRDQNEFFTNDEYQKLLDYTRTAASNHYSLLNTQRVMQEKADEKVQDANYKRLRTAVLEGQGITAELRSANLTDTQFAQLQDLDYKLGQEGIDEPESRDLLFELIEGRLVGPDDAETAILQLHRDEKLTRKTAMELIDRTERRLGEGSQDYQAAQRRMMIALKYDPSTISLSFLQNDERRALSSALRMFRTMVNGGEASPEVAADRVIQHFTKWDVDATPESPVRPSMTPAEAINAQNNGTLSRTEAAWIVREHKRWDRKESEKGGNSAPAAAADLPVTSREEFTELMKSRARAEAGK